MSTQQRLDPARPVSLQGRVAEAGWLPENSRWRDQLLHVDEDGCLAGRNPMDVPVELLTASGHPHRTAQQVFSVWGGCLVDSPARGSRGYASTVWPVPRAGPKSAAAGSTTARAGRTGWVVIHTTNCAAKPPHLGLLIAQNRGG
jgi:hypothetical protein